MLERIYEIDDLRSLREFLSGIDGVRELLLTEFQRYSRYQNATEWNIAVRLCECLAIVGWGDREPLEAVKGVSFNGRPNTFFVNRNAEPRFLDAVWSSRSSGVAIDGRLSFFHDGSGSPIPIGEETGEPQPYLLATQRNWIAKNPIFITRGLANCYENSKAVIDSLEKELKPELNVRMRPELYGAAINRIVLNCSFSFYDNYHCKTNYIIADDSLKLKQMDFYSALLGMFSQKEIDDNGYYLRNRFTYGPFRSSTGMMRVGIVFEKEFSEQSPRRQKQVLSEYLIQAVRQCGRRLRRKIDYDFELMEADFSAILQEWSEKEVGR